MNTNGDSPGQTSIEQKGADHGHIVFFDGLRGGLSLWVFIYHAAITAGFNTGLIPAGAIAVDIFILISGFVMAYTLSFGKASREGFSTDMLIAFYVRRILRIAPVYYLALFIAVVFYGTFLEFSREATAAFPPLWAADMANDPSIKSITLTNIVMHMTFLFGFNPHYAANMPIPDWTLTLEMQFYAVVPLLLVAMRKYGLALPIAGLAILNFLASRYIGLYLTPKIGGLWPQPSMLFFKLDCFVTGMLLALYIIDERFNKVEILCLLLVLTALETTFIYAAIVAVCFSLLTNSAIKTDFFTRLSSFFRAVLQSRPMAFLGSISYDLYLLHPMILLIIIHLLLKHQWYMVTSPAVRFGLLIGISTILVIPASYIVHILVERPCQKAARPVGAWLLARKKSFDLR